MIAWKFDLFYDNNKVFERDKSKVGRIQGYINEPVPKNKAIKMLKATYGNIFIRSLEQTKGDKE